MPILRDFIILKFNVDKLLITLLHENTSLWKDYRPLYLTQQIIGCY